MTRDTIWDSDQNTRKHQTQDSREISPFLAGDHKAARTEDSMSKSNLKPKTISKCITSMTYKRHRYAYVPNTENMVEL